MDAWVTPADADTEKEPTIKKAVSLKDISAKVERLLPVKIKKLLKSIQKIADREKISVFIVGGFVRDLLLGQPSFDMDLVVEANAIDFAYKLSSALPSSVKSYPRFKTAKLLLDDGLVIDIATARTEFYEYPAALPVVESSSLRDDLKRRDFTINTLALSLNKKTFGHLIDAFQAEKDIKQKRVRVLHDSSFIEDPTRIFRAVRFEQRFDFVIDTYTENLIKAAMKLEMFKKLHKSRIGDELELLLSEPHPRKVIRRLAVLCELRFIHPRVKLNKLMLSMLESVDEVLKWYRLSFLEEPLGCWIVYLLVILDVLSITETKQVFTSFNFKKTVQACVFKSKIEAPKAIKSLSRIKNPKPHKIYSAFNGLPLEVLLFMMAKERFLKKKELFLNFLTKYANIRLQISGKDLKTMGICKGPRFKKVLENTLFAKIDGIILSKDEEMKFARKRLRS